MHYSRILKVSTFATVALLAVSPVAGAQTARDSAAYLRAQQMVANGDAVAGRRLADSVAAAAPAGSAAYAEGLYWQATLASNARDSEHAYRQIIVDYPLSGRVADALLRLGQLESARGENAAALQHFQRLVLEHPLSPLRAEGSYWVAKMYFDANDAAHGCVANADAHSSVRASNVELKNRIDFQQQRCRGVTLATNAVPAPVAAENHDTVVDHIPERRAAPHTDVAIAPPIKQKTIPSNDVAMAAPVVTPAPIAKPARIAVDTPRIASAATGGVVSRQPTQEEVDRALASAKQSNLIKRPTPVTTVPVPATNTTKVTKTAKATATKAKEAAKPKRSHKAPAAEESGSSSGAYSVQVAAFGAKSPATLLAARLRGRGYSAYVYGASAPYRVRVGHFSTHAAAATELAKMKARKIDGFVAEQ